MICGKEGPGEAGRIPYRGWQLERQHHQKNSYLTDNTEYSVDVITTKIC